VGNDTEMFWLKTPSIREERVKRNPQNVVVYIVVFRGL
jgi:hypothetical protein